jgi:hypothetical protein
MKNISYKQLQHRINRFLNGIDPKQSIHDADEIYRFLNQEQSELESECIDFLNTPNHIKGLLPQYHLGEINARLSFYCAHQAKFNLQKIPPCVSLAEQWLNAAESCAEYELINQCAFRQKQQKAGHASALSREKNPLTKITNFLVKQNPKISEKALWAAIKKEKGFSVTADDEINYSLNGKEMTCKGGALRSRLSRAKKKFSRQPG